MNVLYSASNDIVNIMTITLYYILLSINDLILLSNLHNVILGYLYDTTYKVGH